MATYKIQGWGYEEESLTADENRDLEAFWGPHLGVDGFEATPFVTLDEIDLRAPRVTPPASLAALCTDDRRERVVHTYGCSFRDNVRAFARDFSNPPDWVAYPKTEDDVRALLDWCAGAGIAAVPYGGGTSVVDGANMPAGERAGAVSIDLQHLDRVLEVDTTSRAARIQGGAKGPALEAELKPHGLSLRHYMQSFALSTFGGWIATRSSGHFATVYTHIDDMIESIRTVTPAGVMESRRLPGSGAGPSPDRLVMGSEGTLGIITEAWTRLHARPVHRASASVRFADFYKAAEAIRAVAQAGLYPANCRLIDGNETRMSGASPEGESLMVLTFESAHHAVDHWLDLALECCADLGGIAEREGDEETRRGGQAGRWRDYFIRAPYYREFFTARGILNETFETAITWDRFPDFHATVMTEAAAAIREVTGMDGFLSCRFTHAYPDGPAPYFTWRTLGRKDALIEQYDAIKAATAETVNRLGGTVTHHHAVGRLHRPWYDKQRPDLFAAAYRGAKRDLDPQGIMNPGVLVDVE